MLEKLAERIGLKLQHLLWTEVLKPAQTKRLPQLMMSPPRFSIGYSSTIFNPCVDPVETVEHLFENSAQAAKIQAARINVRQKEFIQTLIQTDSMLTPFYQGIFHAKSIKESDLAKAKKENSIGPLAPHIYAFESLIRVNLAAIEKIIALGGPVHISAEFLRPDIIFELAYSVKLSLELDQTCLRKAITHFADLPGRLLANILPRNFYYIEKFETIIPQGLKLTLEVAESEAINNLELLLHAKDRLRRRKIGIAIDDFGKGFAGLDRAIKIKPDIIKLDRSLISDIENDEPKRAFVTGLVNGAKISKSMILAEGIEKIEELRVLQKIGVDLVQGFLFHRPQSAITLKEDLSISASDDNEISEAS